MKRIILLVLSVALMLPCMVFVKAKEAQQEKVEVGQVVEYGSYPQTRVTDAAIISALDAQTPENQGYFEDYWCRKKVTGSLKNFGEDEDMMSYKDVSYNNEKYRGIKINSYRPGRTKLYSSEEYSHQNESGYTKGVWYWFKYEPIQWVVFDSERMYAISKQMIDAQPFNNEYLEDDGMFMPAVAGGMRYANDFCYSHIETYLNEVLANIAFTPSELEQLKEINVELSPVAPEWVEMDDDYKRRSVACNKVVLASYEQAFDRAEDLSVEIVYHVKEVFDGTSFTDYAKVQGSAETLIWWLATPTAYGYMSHYVFEGDKPTLNGGGVEHLYGVRPVICLENVLAQQEEEEDKKDKKEDALELASGECNSKIDWRITADGVLTISGKGDMPEWDDSEGSMPPWYERNRNDIESVVIEGKITSIGKLAFYGCENLESITIPKSVKFIDECAFNDCNKLTKIYYGSGAEEWQEISIDDDNIDFDNIEVVYTEKNGSAIKIVVVCALIGVGAFAVIYILKKRK